MIQDPPAVTNWPGIVVFDLAVSPRWNLDGTCYAATARGLYRTTTQGKQWKPVMRGPLTSLATTAVAVHEPQPGAGDLLVVMGVAGGLMESRDNGDTWSSIPLGLPPPVISSIVIHGETVLVGTLDDGVFRSPDSCQTWDAVNAGLLDRHVLCLAVASGHGAGEVVYAGTSSGLAMSQNRGRSWRTLDFASVLGGVEHILVTPGTVGVTDLLMATETSGLWQSGDGGSTWTPVDGLPARLSHIAALLAVGGQPVIADERLVLTRNGQRDAWQVLVEVDPAWAPIVTAAALDASEISAGFVVGLEDGSIRVVEPAIPASQ